MAARGAWRLRAAIGVAALLPAVVVTALAGMSTLERAASDRSADLTDLRDLAALREGRLEARHAAFSSDLAWLGQLASMRISGGPAGLEVEQTPIDARAPLWKEPLRDRLQAFLETHAGLHALRVLVEDGDEIRFVGVLRGSDAPVISYRSERRHLLSADYVEAARTAGPGRLALSGVMIEESALPGDEAGIPAMRAAVAFDGPGGRGVVVASVDLRPWVAEALSDAAGQREALLVTPQGYLLRPEVEPDIAASPAAVAAAESASDESAEAAGTPPPASPPATSTLEQVLPGLIAQLDAPSGPVEAHAYREDAVFLARRVALTSAGEPRHLTLALSRPTSRLTPWPEAIPAWQLVGGGVLVLLAAMAPALRFSASGAVGRNRNEVGRDGKERPRTSWSLDDDGAGASIALEPSTFALRDLLGEVKDSLASSDVVVRCDDAAPDELHGDPSWIGPLLLHLGRAASSQSGEPGVNLCISVLDAQGLGPEDGSDGESKLCVHVTTAGGDALSGFDGSAGFETPMARQLIAQLGGRFEPESNRLLLGVSLPS